MNTRTPEWLAGYAAYFADKQVADCPSDTDEWAIGQWLAGFHNAQDRAANQDPPTEIDRISHELWAAAQLAPGEEIADGVSRVAALLKARDGQHKQATGARKKP